MSEEEITLEQFVGLHGLSGVSFDDIPPQTELDPEYDAATRCTFILDGEAYQAIEDPSDGYRSNLGSLLRCNAADVKNQFEAIQVLGSMRGGDDDVIDFADCRNGKTILSIGTDNADDYYPSFVADWRPVNIAANHGVADQRATCWAERLTAGQPIEA